MMYQLADFKLSNESSFLCDGDVNTAAKTPCGCKKQPSLFTFIFSVTLDII